MSYGGPQKKRNNPHPTITGATNTGSGKPSIGVQNFDGRENKGTGESDVNAPNTRDLTARVIKYRT